uniref:DUF4806 domain-containing protein n=1 Tax=Anopheles atroparvus TaxID=41427 RepID=A0A182JH79_ANOAO
MLVKQIKLISAKQDRLLNLLVPRENLLKKDSFHFESLSNVEQLKEFDQKLVEDHAFAKDAEAWLIALIQEADCRRRLNDAVDLLLTPSCQAQLSWTGAGLNKAGAMQDFENVLRLLTKNVPFRPIASDERGYKPHHG